MIKSTRSLRPEALRSIVALSLRVVGLALGLVTAGVISRALGVSGFGTFSLGLTLLGVVGQLSDSGMANAVAAEISRDPRRTREIATSAVMARLLLGVVAAAFIMAGALGYMPTEDARVVVLFAACAPLGALGAMTGVTNAEIKPQVAASIALLQAALWCGIAVVVAAWSPSAQSFAAGFVVLTVVQASVTAGYFAKRRLFGRPTLAAVRLVAVRAAPMAVLGLLVTAYYRIDAVLLYALAGERQTGLYAAAYRFLDVAQLLPSVLVVPLLPILASTAMDENRRRELVRAIVRIAICVGVGGALAMGAAAPLLITVVYGEQFADAEWPLRLLGVAYVGVVLGYVGTAATFALGDTWSQIPRVAVIAVASVTLQIPAIRLCGASGAAAVTALTEWAVALTGLHLSMKHVGLRLSDLRLLTAGALTALGVTATAFLGSVWLSLLVAAVLFLALIPLRLLVKDDVVMALRRSQ